LRSQHNLIGGSKNTTKSPSRIGSKDLRGIISGYKYQREISHELSLSHITWRTQTDAPNAITSPPLSNFTKAIKAIRVIREEEQRRRTAIFFKI
jgi:hypothetical protein